MSEKWLKIEGLDHYEISDQGNVRSLDREVLASNGKVMKFKGQPIKPQNGYRGLSVCLYQDGIAHSFNLGRLVLTTFSKVEFPDMCCGFRDGNAKNCALSNLYWHTYSDANMQKHDRGTMPMCEKHPNHKLSKGQVKAIKKQIAEAKYGDLSKLADLAGVSRTTIHKIKKQITWGHCYV